MLSFFRIKNRLRKVKVKASTIERYHDVCGQLTGIELMPAKNDGTDIAITLLYRGKQCVGECKPDGGIDFLKDYLPEPERKRPEGMPWRCYLFGHQVVLEPQMHCRRCQMSPVYEEEYDIEGVWRFDRTIRSYFYHYVTLRVRSWRRGWWKCPECGGRFGKHTTKDCCLPF